MFSDREEKIIKIIGNKQLTIAEIAEKLFENEKFVPFDTNITVRNSVDRIIKKCEYQGTTWTLHKNKNLREFTVYKKELSQ